MYQDKQLQCRDCGAEFVFSGSEQEFFAEKGFTNEPSRCPACRSARRAQNGADALLVKCTQQRVQSAEQKQKFLSVHPVNVQYIAVIASAVNKVN